MHQHRQHLDQLPHLQAGRLEIWMVFDVFNGVIAPDFDLLMHGVALACIVFRYNWDATFTVQPEIPIDGSQCIISFALEIFVQSCFEVVAVDRFVFEFLNVEAEEWLEHAWAAEQIFQVAQKVLSFHIRHKRVRFVWIDARQVHDQFRQFRVILQLAVELEKEFRFANYRIRMKPNETPTQSCNSPSP